MKVTGYLGLDVGGSGAKAGVFDGEGRCLGFGQAAYAPTISPEGHAEIPIEEIEAAAREAASAAVRRSGAAVAALAIASQGQTFVTLDAKGQPLHPAILWYDSRAADDADRLLEAVLARVPRESAPNIVAIATAPKVLWMRRHHPEIMARAHRYLLLPDYLAYRLCGEAVTDYSTATTTGLYADDAPDYSPAALAAAEIATEELARIQAPGTPVARVLPSAAAEWNLPEAALVVTGTNDQYAGALGAGNCRPGILTETTGTCLALVTLVEKLPQPLPAGLIGGRFPISRYQFALAFSKTAGLVLDWFRRELSPDKSLSDLESMAAAVPIGSRGLTVLHHFDGMISPRPNPRTRGAICNLTLSHTLGDIYRAILESIAFSLRENIELLRSAGFEVDVVRSIGGGARSTLWLQMKADVCGLPVEKPAVTEAATLGAAMLASVGHGRYASIAECSQACYRPQDTIVPDCRAHALYEEPFQAYHALWRGLYDNADDPRARNRTPV